MIRPKEEWNRTAFPAKDTDRIRRRGVKEQRCLACCRHWIKLKRMGRDEAERRARGIIHQCLRKSGQGVVPKDVKGVWPCSTRKTYDQDGAVDKSVAARKTDERRAKGRKKERSSMFKLMVV